MIYLLTAALLLALYVSYVLAVAVHYESNVGTVRRNILTVGGNIFTNLYHAQPALRTTELHILAECLSQHDVDATIRQLQVLHEANYVTYNDIENVTRLRQELKNSKVPLVNFLAKEPNRRIASYFKISPHSWEKEAN